jgi:hypothetical protein
MNETPTLAPLRSPARLPTLLTLAALAALLGGCVADDDGHSGADPYLTAVEQAAAHSGPWVIPADVRAAGEAQYVPYTSAGSWSGGAGCTGSLMPGTRELADFIMERFSGACGYGGYACRPNTADASRLSVHGTGRAVDIYISTVGGSSACLDNGGAADNDAGDPIGEWLIENAEYIGIQYIIWDWWQWTGNRSGRKDREYCGMESSRCHPHHNHLHVELTPDGAARRTGWFRDRCAASACDGEPEDETDEPEACVAEPVAGAEDALFADMPPGSLGYEEAAILYRAGVTHGCERDPLMFCARCPIKRYEMVIFLLRAAGIEPGPMPSTSTFSDVPTGAWYRPWVEEAARRGITTGCGSGRFCPFDAVTRGQAAAFINRTTGWPALNPATPRFADVPRDHLFYGSIETIADWCVTNGCGDGANYCPDAELTRAQAAIFIARAFNLEGANRCIETCDEAACEAQSWCGEYGPCEAPGTQRRTCRDFACAGDARVSLCESSARTQSRVCTVPEPDPDPDPDADAGPGPDVEPEPDPGPDPDPARDADFEADFDAGSDSSTDLRSDAAPDARDPDAGVHDAPSSDTDISEDVAAADVPDAGGGLDAAFPDLGADAAAGGDLGRPTEASDPSLVEPGCGCAVGDQRRGGAPLALVMTVALTLLVVRRRSLRRHQCSNPFPNQ